MARTAAELLKLGLKPSTCVTIAAQLFRERFEPHTHWKRVSLQPLINYDFFETLYRRYRPDFATWHTNHVAHYMHHYWRAMDDSQFRMPAPLEEKRKYGGAVEYGYEVADTLLGRFIDLIGEDTVIVLASSMGQQPYAADLYPEGKVVVRFKDIHRVLKILGVKGATEVVPTMVPQWNVKIPGDAERARIKGLFERAYVKGGPRPEAFAVTEVENILTVTPLGMARRDGEVRYFFPDAPNADPNGYRLEELFIMDAASQKEGMHHPTGLFTLWGKGIRAGVKIENTTTLDIAPTVLTLLGIPVPSLMKGRVLSEAWSEAPAAAARGSDQPVAQA
jgi:arylsulfatase A-like enzyme